MDFLRIIRSFEDFIFEAVSWLVFYPLTLWRVMTRPLATMAYSDSQQDEAPDNKYDDAVTPPLFLLATIVVANLVALATHTPSPEGTSQLMRKIVDSPLNLVLFRSIIFSLAPLVAAMTLLRRQGQRASRKTLRAPFYAQCYLATPFAAAVSLGGLFMQRPDLRETGGAIMLASAVWFLAVQTAWFRQRLSLSWPSAAFTASWALARAVIYLLLVVLLIALV